MIPWQFRPIFFEFISFQPKAEALYDTSLGTLCSEHRPEMLQSNSQVDVSLPCQQAENWTGKMIDDSLDMDNQGAWCGPKNGKKQKLVGGLNPSEKY